MQKQKRKDKNGALGRYGLIVTLLMLFAVMIIFSAARIVFTSEGKKWREVGEKETVIRDRVILPKRGNIYTYDGDCWQPPNRSIVFTWTFGQMAWKKTPWKNMWVTFLWHFLKSFPTVRLRNIGM